MLNNQEIKHIPTLIKDLGRLQPNKNLAYKARFGIYECYYCKKHFKSRTNNIKNGHTSSCGCQSNRLEKTHGMTGSRIYNIWTGMVYRATTKEDKYYKDYVGRGIFICNEWLQFENFYNDMKDSYADNLSIDRINNDDGYYKENCRWATDSIQAKNKRTIIKSNTSGYVGAAFSKTINKWVAYVKVDCKRTHIGCYSTVEEAAKARDEYVIKNNLGLPLNNIL